MPRGRIEEEDGSTREFQSQVLPRYARRTRRVDEAILGAYLAGANTRRIRRALEPLLGSEHLSKSAVSRLRGRQNARLDPLRACTASTTLSITVKRRKMLVIW